MTDSNDSWVKCLENLHQLFQDEDYEAATKVCKSTLAQNGLPNNVHETVYQILIQCQLRLENFSEISSLAKESLNVDLSPYSIYALYRLGKYKEAIQKASKKEDTSMKHVHAQSLFRLNHTEEASEVYQSLRSSDKDQTQVLTNSLAVAVANGVPYVGSTVPMERVVQEAQDSLSQDRQDYPYDLAFNLAMYNLLSGNDSHALLPEALGACTESCNEDGLTPEETEKEVAPIQAALEWSYLLKGKVIAQNTANASPIVQAVMDCNRAFLEPNAKKALQIMPREPNANWTVKQTCIFYYNRATLSLNANSTKQCRSNLEELRSVMKPKKKQTAKANPSPAQVAWWESRIDSLEAQLLPEDEAASLLQSRLDSLSKIETSKVVDHAMAHVQLVMCELLTKDPVPVLENLPSSIATQPAVVATLASLYDKAGEGDKAAVLLQQSGANTNVGDYFLSQRNYAKAAQVYQELMEAEPDSIEFKAKTVQALSYFDPKRAQEIWNTVDVPELETELDAEAFEQEEIPRFKTSRRTRLAVSFPAKKDHEAVLRRRARKRQEYLTAKGISENQKPNPDRWLPKHARSGRRFHRKGHQGGGISEKDASKLDVRAAKEGGNVNNNAKTTKHYNVASDGKRGRRR